MFYFPHWLWKQLEGGRYKLLLQGIKISVSSLIFCSVITISYRVFGNEGQTESGSNCQALSITQSLNLSLSLKEIEIELTL